MLNKTRYSRGKEGETAAAEHLCGRGLKILDRNFRCAAGEIDLVAKDGKFFVFVEVRSRVSDKFCSPEESLSVHKLRRLANAALWYLKQKGLDESPMRFDVVGIRWRGEKPEINWIVNAFEPR